MVVESLSDDMFDEIPAPDSSRYRCLGLVANPFVLSDERNGDSAVTSEIAAEGNLLLSAIIARSAEEAPRPLTVRKAELPSQYPMRALGFVEPYLAADETLNVLYAYVPLFSMRAGATRATLGVIAERLAFREFRTTLVSYIKSILEAPDADLASFAAIPAGALDEFGADLAADADAAVIRVFGSGGIEMHPELAQVADFRQSSLNDEDTEADASSELDASIGDAPGTGVAESEAVENRKQVDCALFEYFIEYTAVHLSAVVARALRLYRSRGESAFASELRVTKAPRKTLGAVLRLARFRFSGVTFLYDGFENWTEIPEETRAKLMASLVQIRWKTAGLAFPVFLLTPGEAPEVEETFGGSGAIDWDFPGLRLMEGARGELLPDVITHWIEAATVDGCEPLTLQDDILSKLVDAAEGSMPRFVPMAAAAVESAVERGCSALDAEALQAGLDAGGE